MEIRGNRLTFYDTFSERDLEPDRRRGRQDAAQQRPPLDSDDFYASEWEVVGRVRADLSEFMQEVQERRAQYEEERDSKLQRVEDFNARREVHILEGKSGIEALRRDKGDASPAYQRVKEEYEEARDAYRSIEQNQGRPLMAHMRNTVYYWVFALLSVAEIPINLPAIQTVFWESTLLALLLAGVLGLLLMVLAHNLGRLVCQLPHARVNGQIVPHWFFLVMASGVSVGMIYLLYLLRVQYIAMTQVEIAVGTAESGMMFLLYNLAVVLVGMIMSYIHHDPDPEYQSAHTRMVRAKKAFDNLKEEYERERQVLQKRFDNRMSSAAREVERLQSEVEVARKSLANLERQKLAFVDRVLHIMQLRISTYQSANRQGRDLAPLYFGPKRIQELGQTMRAEFVPSAM